MTHVNEREILEAALLGYQSKVSDLQDKMREIVARLNPDPVVVELPTGKRWKPKRHTMSAEGRARIAAAQKKRWKLLKRAAA